jgi:hypothetical protein
LSVTADIGWGLKNFWQGVIGEIFLAAGLARQLFSAGCRRSLILLHFLMNFYIHGLG